MVVLSKDYDPLAVTRADMLFAEGRLAIISCDEEGIIRLNEYDPHGMCDVKPCVRIHSSLSSDPESRNGQRLLCRTEFHGQTEYRSSCLIARRTDTEDSDIPQSKLIYGEYNPISLMTH